MILIPIEMPENCVECDRKGIRHNCRLIFSGCANCGRHPDCPLIELPKGMTNGDVIKAMFPLIEVKREISSTSDNIVVRDNSFFGSINRFHTDWWNAPYERSTDAGSN